MKKSLKRVIQSLLVLAIAMVCMWGTSLSVYATDTESVTAEAAAETEAASESESVVGDKAMAAAIVVGLAAAGGAIAMGMAISKSAESISRQPEAEGKVRTTLMLGLVFVETAIIYALVVAILIIFVL